MNAAHQTHQTHHAPFSILLLEAFSFDFEGRFFPDAIDKIHGKKSIL